MTEVTEIRRSLIEQGQIRQAAPAAAPLGTRAPACMGGAWCRVEHGWKWNGPHGNGSTFARPGGDWDGRLLTEGEWFARWPGTTEIEP